MLLDLGRFDAVVALTHDAAAMPPEVAALQATLGQRRATWQSETAQSLREASLNAREAGQVEQADRLLEKAFERAVQVTAAKPEIQAPDGVNKVVAVGQSSDGDTLVVAENFGYRVFSFSQGESVVRQTGLDQIVSLSADGSMALVMDMTAPYGQRALRCLDIVSGQRLPVLPMPTGFFEVDPGAAGLSPDGTRAAACLRAQQGTRAVVPVWECSSGLQVRQLSMKRSFEESFESLVFSPSGKLLGVNGRSTVALWGLDRDRETPLLKYEPNCPGCDTNSLLGLFDMEGRLFWALDETAVITEKGNRRFFRLNKREAQTADFPRIISVLDDGRTALAYGTNSTQSFDLVTRTNNQVGDWGSELYATRRRSFVALTGDKLQHHSLQTGRTRVIAERHSAPFESAEVTGDTLEVRGPRILRFALSHAHREKSWGISVGSTEVELYDQHSVIPWFACSNDNNQRNAALEPTDSTFVVRCGTELTFASCSAPGITARLKQIGGTATAYALYPDRTAEIWGDIADFRRVARCVVGELVFPLDVCEDDLLVSGRLQALLR